MVKRRRRHAVERRALAFVFAVLVSLRPSVGISSAQARPMDPVSVSLRAIPVQDQPFIHPWRTFHRLGLTASWVK